VPVINKGNLGAADGKTVRLYMYGSAIDVIKRPVETGP